MALRLSVVLRSLAIWSFSSLLRSFSRREGVVSRILAACLVGERFSKFAVLRFLKNGLRFCLIAEVYMCFCFIKLYNKSRAL